MSSPVSTTSWQAPRETVFGSESAIDFSFFRPRTLSTRPCGGCISSTSSSFAATSSSRSTPNARHIRRSVPNWLISSGRREPFVRSNRSAGPPAFTVRSTISVISRSGSTSAETRTSSPSSLEQAIHSRRSEGGAIKRESNDARPHDTIGAVSEREGWIEWGGHRTWFRIAGDAGLGPRPARVPARRARLDASLLRAARTADRGRSGRCPLRPARLRPLRPAGLDRLEPRRSSSTSWRRSGNSSGSNAFICSAPRGAGCWRSSTRSPASAA